VSIIQFLVAGLLIIFFAVETFDVMKNYGTYYIIVIEDKEFNKIVASGSLILEKKFIHDCGHVSYNWI